MVTRRERLVGWAWDQISVPAQLWVWRWLEPLAHYCEDAANRCDRAMRNAWQCAALFNRLGDRWRMSAPADAVMSADGRTVYLGSGWRIERDDDGRWTARLPS